MANTGNKQAVIAYKTRTTDGAPLDINGNPTSETGLKQAIALLAGTANPNPTLYVVEFYFSPDAIVSGNPTVIFDPADCSIGFISITPDNLIFIPADTSKQVTLVSSNPWEISATDAAIAGVFSLDVTSGGAGTFNITITRTSPTTYAQGYVTFRNTISGVTVKLHLANVLSLIWILETGSWNMLGVWTDTGLWKFS